MYVVQNMEGSKFQCTLSAQAAMEQLLRHGGLSICSKTVAVKAHTPRLPCKACLSLPGYVADEHLQMARAPYRKMTLKGTLPPPHVAETGTVRAAGTRVES